MEGGNWMQGKPIGGLLLKSIRHATNAGSHRERLYKRGGLPPDTAYAAGAQNALYIVIFTVISRIPQKP
jgi:hypothetical protein